MLGRLKYQNEVFQARKYIIMKLTYTKKLQLLLAGYF